MGDPVSLLHLYYLIWDMKFTFLERKNKAAFFFFFFFEVFFILFHLSHTQHIMVMIVEQMPKVCAQIIHNITI